MKGTRYTDEQIVRILGEVEKGRSIAEVCRQYGVAEATVYRWRAKYRGMDRAQLKKLKQLEVENRRLKRIVAREIGHRRPEGSIGKRMVSPSAKVVRDKTLRGGYRLAIRPAGAPEDEEQIVFESEKLIAILGWATASRVALFLVHGEESELLFLNLKMK